MKPTMQLQTNAANNATGNKWSILCNSKKIK
jgi:hypothetical protein